MTFGAATADNWTGGAPTGDRRHPPAQFQYVGTDANGVASYDITSPDDGYGTHVLRVLAPTNPAPGVPHNFLYVLPVEPELGTDLRRRARDLAQPRRTGQVQPHDHRAVVRDRPVVRGQSQRPEPPVRDLHDQGPRAVGDAELSADRDAGHEQNWLIGFSKSGIGGEDLLLKHPDLFATAASWDFPADMASYDQFGSSSADQLRDGRQLPGQLPPDAELR